MTTFQHIEKALQKKASAEKAKNCLWFFKTGKGEYGEGDIFIGVTVPEQHKISKQFKEAPLPVIKKLLKHRIHEYRMTGLFILTIQFQKADVLTKKTLVDFYLKNLKGVNNWDLVDLSAPKILGPYLIDKNRKILYTLAHTKNLWQERISIIATAAFIRNNDFTDTLKLAQLFLNHKHDLMHKAVGWMLREIGKRNKKVETAFLKKYYTLMPRTMLRYAIEKFPEAERKKYLKGRV